MKNYKPKSITFLDGFTIKPTRLKNLYMKVDYDKAVELIKERIDYVESAELGLDGDWEWCSCFIYKDGVFEEYSEWDNSYWAKPTLIIHYKDGTNESFDCYTIEKNN